MFAQQQRFLHGCHQLLLLAERFCAGEALGGGVWGCIRISWNVIELMATKNTGKFLLEET